MGGINIERTPVQGERNRVIVQCRVSGRVVLDSVVVKRTEGEGSGKQPRHTVWIGVLVNLATNSWT